MATPTTRRRIAAGVLLAGVVVSGLAVHAWLPDTAATDVAGDALYAAAVYLAVIVAAPRLRAMTVATITAAACIAIELFQLTGIPLAGGIAFPPSMLVLGTVFDARDLVVYVITALVVGAADVAWAARPSGNAAGAD